MGGVSTEGSARKTAALNWKQCNWCEYRRGEQENRMGTATPAAQGFRTDRATALQLLNSTDHSH